MAVLARILAARRFELASVALAATAAAAIADPSEVPVAALLGYFAAKSVGSLRRATA